MSSPSTHPDPCPDHLILFDPSSYPFCDITRHRLDSVPISVLTQRAQSPDALPPLSTSSGNTTSRQFKEASVTAALLSPTLPAFKREWVGSSCTLRVLHQHPALHQRPWPLRAGSTPRHTASAPLTLRTGSMPPVSCALGQRPPLCALCGRCTCVSAPWMRSYLIDFRYPCRSIDNNKNHILMNGMKPIVMYKVYDGEASPPQSLRIRNTVSAQCCEPSASPFQGATPFSRSPSSYL